MTILVTLGTWHGQALKTIEDLAAQNAQTQKELRILHNRYHDLSGLIMKLHGQLDMLQYRMEIQNGNDTEEREKD